jgi:hypothetical protein
MAKVELRSPVSWVAPEERMVMIVGPTYEESLQEWFSEDGYSIFTVGFCISAEKHACGDRLFEPETSKVEIWLQSIVLGDLEPVLFDEAFRLAWGHNRVLMHAPWPPAEDWVRCQEMIETLRSLSKDEYEAIPSHQLGADVGPARPGSD